MNLLWLLASAAAAITFCTHTFVGSRYAAPPLLASDLPLATRGLNYLCWHMITLNLLVMTGALLLAGLGHLGRDAVIICVVLSVADFLVSMYTTLKLNIPPYRFPSTYLFPIVAGLAIAGF